MHVSFSSAEETLNRNNELLALLAGAKLVDRFVSPIHAARAHIVKHVHVTLWIFLVDQPMRGASTTHPDALAACPQNSSLLPILQPPIQMTASTATLPLNVRNTWCFADFGVAIGLCIWSRKGRRDLDPLRTGKGVRDSFRSRYVTLRSG
jgi:hypothetical protein